MCFAASSTFDSSSTSASHTSIPSHAVFSRVGTPLMHGTTYFLFRQRIIDAFACRVAAWIARVVSINAVDAVLGRPRPAYSHSVCQSHPRSHDRFVVSVESLRRRLDATLVWCSWDVCAHKVWGWHSFVPDCRRFCDNLSCSVLHDFCFVGVAEKNGSVFSFLFFLINKSSDSRVASSPNRCKG